MEPLNKVTDEILAKAKDLVNQNGYKYDRVSKALTSASGFAGYDLQPIAILLQPVITPFRNRFPRVQHANGALSAAWKYISSLITAGVSDATPSSEGAKGNALSYSATPVTAAFAELALSDSVTFGAIDAAKGFEDQLLGKAHTNLLYALMMVEEQKLAFDRIANLGAVTAPTLSSAALGGAIADGTYGVKVRAITGTGDNSTTRGRLSSATSSGALTGSPVADKNILYAYTDWVEGAIGYEWYVTAASGSTYYYQQTTGTNCMVLKTAPVTTGTAPNIAAPADNVANALGMNGLVAQLTAANGAQIKTLDTDTSTGLGTDFTLDDVDALNKSVWDNAKGDPEIVYMNSTQRARMTKLWQAANGGPTTVVEANSGASAALRGGYLLREYVNVATGSVQQLVTHPYLPDGTMVGLSHQIPFPTGGDMNGVDVEVSTDYREVDYAMSQNRYDFGVYAREVLRVKYPGGAWVLRNIKSNAKA